jgi:hypothetical protein
VNGQLRTPSTFRRKETVLELTSVGNENLGILNPFRAVYTDRLVKDEPFIKVRIRKLSANLLDDLNMFEIG